MAKSKHNNYPVTMMATTITGHIQHSDGFFEAQERADTDFCSKFILAVDTHFQLWLKDCRFAVQCDRVNSSILDCRQIIEAVRFGTFSTLKLLPSSFSMPTSLKEPEAVKN